MAKNASGSRAKNIDRRRKMRNGIIIVKYDRRQNDNDNCSGHDKRSGVDRRSIGDRRKQDY